MEYYIIQKMVVVVMMPSPSPEIPNDENNNKNKIRNIILGKYQDEMMIH